MLARSTRGAVVRSAYATTHQAPHMHGFRMRSSYAAPLSLSYPRSTARGEGHHGRGSQQPPGDHGRNENGGSVTTGHSGHDIEGPPTNSTDNLSPYTTTSVSSQTGLTGHERKHCERRVLPFTPRELYDVVSNVEEYSQFVPWCTRSIVRHRISENHVAAELAVGFQMLSERYTSLVTFEPYKAVRADVPNSSLFDYLINDWVFEDGPEEGTTLLTFYVEFRFRNPLYQRITDLFFNEVVKNMVNAFERRAHSKYGRRPPPGQSTSSRRRSRDGMTLY